ncbi:MAG: heme exporter protein CcmD [Natronospirillum sp.]|uniref:heme exporter protein CcmD n=1 Tax=Natronospirillum sp. TaxID=2812955 RepID=UPI0025F147EE|nr:heme exporter protein CcmD [Natronospirillum sp.]MCH8551390.1 heme exporter protein CcmD [Natronospirillum sp.]
MGYFDSFSDFIRMGNHGVFVWSVYGITVFTILGHWLGLRLQKRRLVTEMQRLKKRGQL